ncbi:acyl-CoA thioesterase [Natrarchaeobius chitinivorans]|uniref:Acyl-CoA thioesterase n=1 Tax=Natrarchaeobius chitinivorans TaxID=1679083 RepID=A0A3N6MFD4_NATCH|nr:thioesterase family protein [Natrarchaeobius chitinivorans]RQG95430.1 acyl-CoA thioesterase [Natrarchaeobius chitinivorans]
MTSYNYETEIQTRYRDIDAMNHVNNAVYASYLEAARLEYFRDVVGERLERTDTVIVRLAIDYTAPIELDQDVLVALGVDNIGESSITMEYEIRADGDVAATARTVQAIRDDDDGTSTSVPEHWQEQIACHEIDYDSELE